MTERIDGSTHDRRALTHTLARALALLAPLLGACASTTAFHSEPLGDGAYKLKCDGPLPACLRRAEDVCKGNPYEVMKARDQRDRYGAEVGQGGQVEIRTSEAIVRCGQRGKAPPPTTAQFEDQPETFRLRRKDAVPEDRPAVDPSLTSKPVEPAPTALPQRACIPGSTQACIGPGKCEGGQSCLPEGNGFGPCDCGTLGVPMGIPPATPLGSAAAATPGTKPAPAKPGTKPAPAPGPTPNAAPPSSTKP